MRESERLHLESPMSFTGATKRVWQVTDTADNPWIYWLLVVPVVVLTLLVVWTVIALWYVVWGLLLFPLFLIFRLTRRGARKRKIEDARHHEMLTAIERSNSGPADTEESQRAER